MVCIKIKKKILKKKKDTDEEDTPTEGKAKWRRRQGLECCSHKSRAPGSTGSWKRQGRILLRGLLMS